MKRVFKIAGLSAISLVVIIAALIWLGFRASLPTLDGNAALVGLSAPVTIQRDALGVPTLTAVDRNDLARALGYAHAQDRFFQMDLLRRAAAGELSELLGPGVLPLDRRLRLHRFRTTAHAVVVALDPAHRALLDAYVAGVNAGLASLRSRPFEYWLLQTRPRPWVAEDSVLSVHAMFLQLQDPQGHAQLQRGLLRAALPAAAARFIDAGAPEWEAAADGSPLPEPVVPGAADFDLHSRHDLPVALPDKVLQQLGGLGSNNWAVAGSRTATGSALVANDMHLGFRVPNIWYRARLIQTSANGIDVTGVTLPGAPLVVAGSNGSVAWGFTNSYGQFESVIRLVPVPGDADAYQTAAGPQRLTYVDELIAVKGGTPETLHVALTPWGPVMGQDWEGHRYALAWTAHDPEAVNLNLSSLEHAKSVQEALHVAASFGIPGQNLMLGDKAGHIAWTIGGRLPLRGAIDVDLPQLSTDRQVGFSGWLAPADQPRIVDPAEGLLWSANARVIGGDAALAIGDDGMDRGARAAQIHADLQSTALPVTPAASLKVQLDDRALFLERWRDLLSEILEQRSAAGDRRHDEARGVLKGWSGHAMPADAAYRLVHAFRAQVQARVYFMLIGPVRKLAPDFAFEIPGAFEGPLWRLVRQRPLHLLAAQYADWNALLLEALEASEHLPPGCKSLSACTWGIVNAVHVTHPLSRALPALAGLLDMRVAVVPGGHADMPRVQGEDYGASERFSVSPGHEAEGYFHMPGGQSGHPLSRFYHGDFEAWAKGTPTPFLPGTAVHSLVLAP